MRKFFTELFKKMVLNPKLAVLALSAVMVATTAVSFTYWKTGIEGSESDRNLQITIGSGDTVTTVVNVAGALESNLQLIPHTRPDIEATNGRVKQITFTFNVTWLPSGSIGSSDETNFIDHPGELSVTLDHIWLGNVNPIDIKDTKVAGSSSANLILVAISHDTTIKGSSGITTNIVEVTVTIEMNEPGDRAQYDLINGQNLELELTFAVTSQYDINPDWSATS